MSRRCVATSVPSSATLRSRLVTSTLVKSASAARATTPSTGRRSRRKITVVTTSRSTPIYGLSTTCCPTRRSACTSMARRTTPTRCTGTLTWSPTHSRSTCRHLSSTSSSPTCSSGPTRCSSTLMMTMTRTMAARPPQSPRRSSPRPSKKL